ncbi:M56 family metallopeptidase [Longimicrobium terrae]|nr:M56 family metallopeptidase [Longimicrobium terrae]
MIMWMAFCLAVGALLCAGATALEAALRALRLPARGVWIAALALSVAIPAAARWVRTPPAPRTVSVIDLGGSPTTDLTATVSAEPPARPTPVEAPPSGIPEQKTGAEVWDAWLGTGWIVLCALAGAWWAAAWVLLAMRRRAWREAVVDGVSVLVSPSTGPAVVGLLRGRIVLPEWVAAEADEGARALLLRHEAEHLRAGDPRLLAVGFLCAALMPWNPALWWQLRRLRLAMEVDCDARVLARGADVRAYGALLLDVGRRGGSGRLLPVAFSHPRSFLERRIRMMTQPALPRRRRALAALAVAALVAVGGMRMVPLPELPTTARRILADTTQPRLLNAEDVTRAIGEHYPPLLRDAGITGQVTVRLWVGADGSATLRGVDDATDPRFIEPATRAMEGARFQPARTGGIAIGSTLLLPLRFRPGRALVGPPRDTVQPVPASGPGFLRAIQQHYPPLLRDAGVSGGAALSVRVDAAGAPTVLRVEMASDDRFRDPSIRVVRGTRFRPARVDGRAVEYTMVIPIVFEAPGTGPSDDAGREPTAAERRAMEQAGVEYERRDTAIHEALRARHPDILRRGSPPGQYVYFLADEQGRILASGTGLMGREPWSNDQLLTEMRRLHPDRFIVGVQSYKGYQLGPQRRVRANLAWVTVR